MNNYLITHLHTAYGSVGDSILRNEELIKKAKELNMKAICITDHGSLSNMYSFYYDCIAANIQPIIGCEVYICDDKTIKDKDHKKSYHMILIAKNKKGIDNLREIVSDASVVGMYYKPRTDLKTIKKYSEGLICTTACVGGYAPKMILNDETDKAIEHIKKLKTIFKDDLYLEIQPGKFTDQVTVNLKLIEIAEDLNIKLIAANDVHYANKDEWKAHDFHVRITRKLKAPEDPGDSVYVDKIYYIMSREELFNAFDKELYGEKIINDAIDNTLEIQNKCEAYCFNNTELNLPTFDCPNNLSPQVYIEQICMDRLDQIQYMIDDPNRYIDRLKYELNVIEDLGFTSYFLIMKDIYDAVRGKGYLIGPGRGSVCGSLVAYLLQLTVIDPIKYNLMFERFLSYERKGSVPDIDTDFESGEGREYAFEYTINKYGLDHCAAVSTYSIRKSRSAIRSVCKLYEIELSVEDSIAKLIPQSVFEETEDGSEKKTDLSIAESLEIVPELREWQEIYPHIFEMAMQLEGLPSHTGIHAAGTLITKTKVTDFAPLLKQEKKELNAIALDLHDAESQMAVKFDYLAINNLNIIKECQELTGDVFDQEFSNYDDSKIWNLIGSRNTTGLFQIGSNTYKQRMPRLHPSTIKQLADCLALVRGPCIQSKLDEKYMRIVEGKEEIELIHPLYDKEVTETNGILIYQEQMMKVCNNMGLPLYDCYKLMKATAKKKHDVVASYKQRLYETAKDVMDDETFEYIFKLVLDSAKYSFKIKFKKQ